MQLCRFKQTGSEHARYGMIEGDEVFPFDSFNLSNRASLDELAEARVGSPVPLGEVRLLAPVAPSKIVCVGRNYKEHAAELGNPMPSEPLLFFKPPSSIIAHDEAIELPRVSAQVEYEGELGVVIGRRASHLKESDDALQYVFGYTCVNDVTARDLQRKDVQFTRAKSFDTFCPVGPYVVTNLDPSDVKLETRLNSETRQSGRTAQMAFPVAYLIRYISHVMTLEAGDLISTGTPAGVGPMQEGDTVEVEIEGVGVLRNNVRARETAPADV
ncbi:MAG TPA: fumarylacetoacetate hydrolase family protein [Pyrinomonadaceae bacterium]|jgi:2-keto-4-pentenoate hydratase/2-oxohepta-3-ene-1,7-dioic acid hydratase in catechol pathway|nr:fumarylacetoacetate hydrolase family protein [Pyrinomonadaceae bacterium]